MPETRECSVDGCSTPWRSKGMCDKHYYRNLRYGTPTEPLHWRVAFDGQDSVEHFWSKVALTADPNKCWEWQRGLSRDGYGLARLNNKSVRAHRVAWFLEHGEMPSNLVLHSCDNRTCVNPNHLRTGSPKDNAQDAVSRNRTIRGDRHSQAKLGVDEVRVIKSLLSQRISQRKIAKRFGVSQHSIGQIHQNKTWVWVTGAGEQLPLNLTIN